MRHLLFVGKDADNRRHLFKVQIYGLILYDPADVIAAHISEAVAVNRELVALDSLSALPAKSVFVFVCVVQIFTASAIRASQNAFVPVRIR